jgi:hypothetical protein
MAINSLSTGFRPGVCTSGTRPTAPYIGQHIYETDTLLEYVWNGSIWVRLYTAATTTKGDIDTYSTAPARLAVGTNGQTLTANSNTATGLEWQSRQYIQYQGGVVTVPTTGITITFVSGRFSGAPSVVALPGYVSGVGANPSGFLFIPYGGGPSSVSVILASTSGTLQSTYAALWTNI